MDSGFRIDINDFLAIMEAGGYEKEKKKTGFFSSKEFFINQNQKIVSYDGREIKMISFKDFKNLNSEQKTTFEKTVALVETLKKDEASHSTFYVPAEITENRQITVVEPHKTPKGIKGNINVESEIFELEKEMEAAKKEMKEVNEELTSLQQRLHKLTYAPVAAKNIPIHETRASLIRNLQEKMGEENGKIHLQSLEKGLEKAFNEDSNVQHFQNEIQKLICTSPTYLASHRGTQAYIDYAEEYKKVMQTLVEQGGIENLYNALCKNADFKSLLEKSPYKDSEELEKEVTTYLTELAGLKFTAFGAHSLQHTFPFENCANMQLIQTSEGIYLASDGIPFIFDAEKNTFVPAELDLSLDLKASPKNFGRREANATNAQIQEEKIKKAMDNFSQNKVFLAPHMPFFSSPASMRKEVIAPQFSPKAAQKPDRVPQHDQTVDPQEKLARMQRQCAKAKEDLASLGREKNNILTLLSKYAGNQLAINNPTIADLSDTNRPTKIAEKFSSAYTDEWADAYDDLPFESDKEKTDLLLKCVKEAFSYHQKHKDIPALEAMKQLGVMRDDFPSGKMEEAFNNFRAHFQTSAQQKVALERYLLNIIEENLLPKLQTIYSTVNFRGKTMQAYLEKIMELSFFCVRQGIFIKDVQKDNGPDVLEDIKNEFTVYTSKNKKQKTFIYCVARFVFTSTQWYTLCIS